MRLRPYQTKATSRIDAEWKAGHRAVLLVMPPNAGKTVVFLHVIRKALKRGERVCVVAPNVVLTQQTIDKFSHIDHGIIWADKTTGEDKQLQIASAPTLANRLDEYEFDLIVVDEAHHCAANTWKKILDRYNTARVLGVTATAKRLDGKGLDTCGFTGLVRGPWIDALTPQHMTPFRMWAPNVPELLDAPEGSDYKAADLAKHGIEMGVLIGDAVKHYTKHCAGKRALAFCMSIEDSKATVKRFARAGYKAAHMDGNTPHEERRALLDALNARRLDLISSCNVLGEGLDIPGVDVVIQLRPTRSYQMWLQQLGRGFRLDAENPDKLLDVIDCAGNYFRFWSPSVDRGYGLDGAPSLDVERQQTQRRCGECGLVYMADGRGYCPECHAETAAAAAADTERRAVWRDGELVQVGGMVFPNKNIEGRYILYCGGIYFTLGNDRNESLARTRFENFIESRIRHGRNPVSLEEANLWCGRSVLRELKFPVPTSAGVYGFKDSNIHVSLGTTNIEKLARRRFENYIAARALANRPPIDKVEADKWKYVDVGLNPIYMPKPNAKGSFVLWDSGMHIFLGDIGIEEIAKQRFQSYSEQRDLHGRLPITKDEANEWKLKSADMIPLRFPSPNHRGTLAVQIGRNRIYIGNKSDMNGAQYMLDLLNAKRNLWKREPINSKEAREWMQMPQKRNSDTLPLQSSITNGHEYFSTRMRYKGKTIAFHLGSDRAIAKARVDQASARFKNGYKWPDTAEEFREWLTLPPPS